MTNRIRLVTLASATVFYVGSMFLPLVSLNIFGPSPPCLGWVGFVFGLLAITTQPLFFVCWLANPAFLAGLGLLIARKPSRSSLAGLVGCGLAMVVLPSGLEDFTQWPGYWVWLGSFATLVIGSAACAIAQRRQRIAEDALDSSALFSDRRDERITASPAPRSTP